MAQSSTSRFLWCSVLFLILLFCAGFRWDVGIDWESYYNMFDGSILTNETFKDRIEPINLIILYLLQDNGFSDGRYWIWVMATITLLFVTKAIYEYSPSVVKSFLLFFVLGFFFDSLNGVRQFCAVAITFYSWRFILKRDILLYIPWILFAAMFHSSAVVAIPLYFFYNNDYLIKHCRSLTIMAVIIAPISTILAPAILMHLPFESAYQDETLIKYATGSGNILSYLRMIYPLFFLNFMIRFCKRAAFSEDVRFFISTCVFGMLLLIAFPTTQLIIRLSYYFQIGLIILLPFLRLTNQITLPIRKRFWLMTIFYSSVYLVVNYMAKPIAKIMPYTLRTDLLDTNLIMLLFTIIIIFSIIFLLFPLHKTQKSLRLT